MGVTGMFGFSTDKIFAKGRKTAGRVTSVKTGWWLTVNKTALRVNNAESAHPHVVSFCYSVQGKKYFGRRYLSAANVSPEINDNITVYYDPDNPHKYAVQL